MFQVEFNICTDKRSKKQYAINIKLIEQNTEYGYITMLKENYGFLEMTSQQTDVFFHYRYKFHGKGFVSSIPRNISVFFVRSSTKTPSNQLNVGDEVKFNLRKNANKMSAENLTKLSCGTIQMPVSQDVFFLWAC
jgi:cold shock CspA family protein